MARGKQLEVRITGDTSGLSRAFGDAEDRAGKFGGKMRDIGSKIGGWLSAGAVAGGAALGAGIVAGVSGYLNKTNLTASLEGSLGVSPEYASKLGEAAGAAYANGFGGSMEEAYAAVEAVNQSFGDWITDDQLAPVTEQALALAEVFRVDVNDALLSAGQMVKNGLVSDAQEGIDVLTAGLQGVPQAVREEILSATQEYSKHFANLGLSGSEAIKLLKSSDGVIGVDKMGDALKELTIRATDMSKSSENAFDAAGLNAEDMAAKIAAGGPTAREGFKEIVAGLQGIEDPVKQANAAIGLFGTPLEDLGVDRIPAFLNSLSGVEGGLGDVSGKAKEMADKLAGTPTRRIEQFKRKALAGLSEVVAKYVIPAVETAGEWIGERLPGWIEQGRGALGRLTEWWNTDGEEIRAKAGEIFGKVQEVVANVVQFVRDNWPVIKETIDTGMQAVRDVISSVVEIVQTLWNNFGDNILNTAKKVFPGVLEVVQDVWKMISGVFETVSALLKGDWEGVWEGIKQVLSSSLDFVRDTFDNAMTLLQGAAGIAWEVLRSIIAGAWDKVKELAAWALQWVVDEIAKMPEKVSTAASGMWDGIKDAFKAAINWIIGKWNDLSFTLPSAEVFGQKVGGWTLDTPNIDLLEYHSGGIVRGGPVGSEVPIMALAGERVLSLAETRNYDQNRAASGGGGGLHITIVEASNPRETARQVVAEIRRMTRADGGRSPIQGDVFISDLRL